MVCSTRRRRVASFGKANAIILNNMFSILFLIFLFVCGSVFSLITLLQVCYALFPWNLVFSLLCSQLCSTWFTIIDLRLSSNIVILCNLFLLFCSRMLLFAIDASCTYSFLEWSSIHFTYCGYLVPYLCLCQRNKIIYLYNLYSKNE